MLIPQAIVQSGGGTPAAVACRATRGTNQSIADATWTPIDLLTETFDTSGMHDGGGGTPSRITVPTTGYYTIDGNVLFAASGVGERYIAIAINGSRQLQLPLSPTSSGNNYTRSTGDIFLVTAAQYIEVHVFQDTGGPLNVVAASLAVGLIGT